MTDISKIHEHMSAGDYISAETVAREALTRDPTDVEMTCAFASILRKTGRAAEAVSVLEGVVRALPKRPEVLLEFARAQRDQGQLLDASAAFIDYAGLAVAYRSAGLREAAVCLYQAGKVEQSAAILAELKLLPDGILLNPQAIVDARQSRRIADNDAIDIMCLMAKAGDEEARTLLALALWDTGDVSKRRQVMSDLPNMLWRMGRVEDAVEIYRQAVDLGLEVSDFRPKSTLSNLAASDAALAKRLFIQDRDRFNTRLRLDKSAPAKMWTPVADAWGAVDLRGVASGSPASVAFEVRPASLASGNAATVPGTFVRGADGLSLWQATSDSFLPGQEYAIRMVADGFASEEILFGLPDADPDSVHTVLGDNIGTDAAAFAARVVHFAPEARYRFEYGADPHRLDLATEWSCLPPPRTARAYQKIYWHTGEWHPTCANPSWIELGAEDRAVFSGPGLLLGAPFAKDRNQLNGIGPHEMLVGIAWTLPRPESAEGGLNRHAWLVGGGTLDLRDAEISFTMCGRELNQRNTALHFWISHIETDDIGRLISQWALTSQPYPDDVLDNSTPRKVSITLPDDPRAWTYTGNNPQEQGERANRYRRAALDTTLSANNMPFVLIMAYGDVRRPPTGGLAVYDAEIFYRDASVLSPAAGAELVRYPLSRDDPRLLTAGANGYEDQFWTSGYEPALPLDFEWKLKQPVRLTHFQICQHPYWPAREVEILVADETGAWRSVWSGTLPEGRPDKKQSPNVVEYLDGGGIASAVTLRILSGYYPARCGLDSFQLYGSGADFFPDGKATSLSAEVKKLTPGSTVYYRVVLEDGEEMLTGETLAVALPATQAPIIESATPLVRARNNACYVVRANAMGLETELWGELRQSDGQILAGKKISLGSQPTGRHINYVPEGVPESPGELWLCARNVAGTAALQVPWPCR